MSLLFYIGNRDKLKDKWRKEFIKSLDERKPLSVKDLEFAFTGLDFKNYYHFTNHDALPIERFAVKKTILAWMALALDVKEFDNLVETGKLALQDGLKTGKSASKIGFIFEEMEFRRKEMFMHTELLYQFIALHYIREDENPEIFSQDIHVQKIQQFKTEVQERGSSFFLTKKELKLLYDMTEWSEQEWTIYYHESLVKQVALKEQLRQMNAELLKE